MLKNLLSLVFIGVSALSWGQTGNYLLTHYSPKNEEIDHVSFDIAQDNRGVLYFANKAGILEFDGRSWNIIKTPAPIYTISVTPDGTVYGGGLSGFGRVRNGANGHEYESLTAAQPEATNIFTSAAVKDRVFFLSGNNLYVVDGTTGSPEKTIAPSSEQGMFKNLFEVDGELYVNTDSDEIFLWKDGALVRSQFNPSAGEILFSHALAGTRKTLIGTSADRVFIYESGFFTEVNIKDIDYLHSNVLVSGAWVNESLIGLATLRGGLIFVNPANGETQEITNYYTGLPDNEVYALLGDNKESIWVAHDYGFTRIAPFQPFRTFNHYPGLEGNLLCAYSAPDGGVYVGTSLGLFKLVKDEVYEEEEYFVTKKKKVVSKEPEENEDVAVNQVEKARRGLFGLGRKKDKKKQEEPVAVKPDPKEKKSEKTTTVNTRERRTRKVLKSLQYKYVRVQGINGKVTHLVNVQGQLMAAGLGGVFIINDKAGSVLTSEPVRSIFLSPSLKQLFVSTYNEEIKSYNNDGSNWRETHMLDTLQEYVSYMFEDKLQNLWLCGRSGVLKVEMIDNEITNVVTVPYLKPSIDETVGLAKGSDVYVVNAGEFQLYDPANDKFAKYDSLPGTRKYFASAGSFWFHDGHRWRTIDEGVTKAMQLEWLGLFADIRFLSMTNDATGMWVITADNELYRFTPTASERPTSFPLFLRGIRGPESGMVEPRHLKIEEEKGALTFEFVQPDYNGFETIEYRYLLAGLNDVWSAWSPKNNEITFPFLPSGEYEIAVQSMNIFGKVSEVDRISISVLPPYWRTPWFYALEVAFFSMLVLLSVRLSVSNEKYRPISRVLSLLTVIMFIQLVQTTAYSLIDLKSSPVVEFLIQVTIALLVLPLEMRLRKFMDEASQGKYDLAKLFGRKDDKRNDPIL
ncbi:MAG TPA: triple tyrosine motif-containing protein [Cyclobacteriaceae bacterium]|nr:triple tyrosine motif-containing protein [Cyclobacteriaceae bacterium]